MAHVRSPTVFLYESQEVVAMIGPLNRMFPAFSPVVSAGKLYKWVDANGNVSYQDTPPPEGQKYEATQLSDKKLGRLKTEKADTKLDDIASAAPISLYIVSDCDSCDFVRSFLDNRGVPYTAKNVESDEALKNELMDKAKKMQVPATEVGGKVVFGYRKTEIESALVAAGYPSSKPSEEKDEAVSQN